MLSCREYIFKLTSGQLAKAGRVEKFWAAQHRMICRRCRAFTVNDGHLEAILHGYKAHLLAAPEEPEAPA